jgi:hypothetical protein
LLVPLPSRPRASLSRRLRNIEAASRLLDRLSDDSDYFSQKGSRRGLHQELIGGALSS